MKRLTVKIPSHLLHTLCPVINTDTKLKELTMNLITIVVAALLIALVLYVPIVARVFNATAVVLLVLYLLQVLGIFNLGALTP